MFKLLKRIGKKWWLYLVLVLFILIQVASEVALPTVMGDGIRIIQNIHDASLRDYSLTVLIAIVVFAALALISSIIVGLLTSKVASIILSNTRKELYEKIAKFSSDEMNKFPTTSLLTRMTNDFTQVNLFLNYAGRYLIYGPLIAVYALVIMLVGPNQDASSGPWRIPWEIMVLIAVLLVVVLTLIGIVVKLAFKRQIEIQTRMDHLNLLTRENLEGLRVVRAYNAEDYQEEKYTSYNEKLNKVNKFTNRMIAIFNPAIMFLAAIMTICIGWIGAKMVAEATGEAKSQMFANITVYTQFAGLIIAGIVLAIFAFTTLPRALTSTKRIFEVLDSDVSIKDGNGAQTNEVGTIEFKNVTYTYPGADVPVVKNLSFKVNKGETVAFIGATGSGKSTVVNLLLRFMDTTEGEILVDGVNVKEYKLNDLFKRFGYVPQKGYLFHDSLRNNVCVGKPDATDEQFVRAIEISQSADFVEKLPNQYEYEVSQGGRNVSGGQRQRLCIARAIIMEPEIFVFDDSFSALDYRTDKILRRTIKERCEGTTNVIVAQRVGTIIDADQIIVLDEGNVVGHGKHDELLKNCSVYQEIANSQLGKEGK